MYAPPLPHFTSATRNLIPKIAETRSVPLLSFFLPLPPPLSCLPRGEDRGKRGREIETSPLFSATQNMQKGGGGSHSAEARVRRYNPLTVSLFYLRGKSPSHAHTFPKERRSKKRLDFGSARCVNLRKKGRLLAQKSSFPNLDT